MGKYLSPDEVESIYGIPKKTLANWRCSGRGPAYYKYGSRIRYLSEDMEQWIQGFRKLTMDMPNRRDLASL